jgi:hypothetical protein
VEGGGKDPCVQCFFVDTQLSAVVQMFKLYRPDNPDKNSYQKNLCITTCEKTKEEKSGLEIELDNTYKDLMAKREIRKSAYSTRLSTLTRELREKNKLINQKKNESLNRRPEKLIKEIDKWSKLNKEYETLKKIDEKERWEEEKEQTAEIYNLYFQIKKMNSIQHDANLKKLGAQEEHNRKLFEAFLNEYLKNDNLRKEVEEINKRIRSFFELFKKTKYFLSVDFLKEPFAKVLEVIKKENTIMKEETNKGEQRPPLPRGRNTTRSDRRRGSIHSSSRSRMSRRRSEPGVSRRSRNSDPGVVRSKNRSRTGSLGKVMKD